MYLVPVTDVNLSGRMDMTELLGIQTRKIIIFYRRHHVRGTPGEVLIFSEDEIPLR
jgi:hypothetical protein